VAFTSDGRQLITSEDGVLLRNIETGRVERALPELGSAFALAADGDALVSSDGRGFTVTRLDGELVRRIAFQEPLLRYPVQVAVSADGRVGVAGDFPSRQRQLGVVDLATGATKSWLRMPRSMLYDVPAERAGQMPLAGAPDFLAILSPSGTFVAVAGVSAATLYHLDTGRRKQLMRLPEVVIAFAFSSDEARLGAVLFDGSLHTWSLSTGRRIDQRAADSEQFDVVTQAAVSLDVDVVAAQRWDGALTVTHLRSGNTMRFAGVDALRPTVQQAAATPARVRCRRRLLRRGPLGPVGPLVEDRGPT